MRKYVVLFHEMGEVMYGKAIAGTWNTERGLTDE